MDRLDRISIWAIVLLIISSFALVSGHMGEARPDRKVQQGRATVDPSLTNGEMERKVKLIRNLMEGENLAQAEILTKELIQKYPFEGESHMIMGDVLMRRQQSVKAMLEYKEAVSLNPDYLDKKTPLFQGKKLKTAVREALAEIDKTIRLNPGDESLKNDRKVIYYLQRKIAGSCG